VLVPGLVETLVGIIEHWGTTHARDAALGGAPVHFSRIQLNRPISVYLFPRRALTLCPQLCTGIQPGACFSRAER